MLFNSVQFLIFYPIVLIIYYILPAKKNLKSIWLLLASYYFYMCWNPKYILLLMTSTLVTYISGYLLDYINKKNDTKEKSKKLKNCVVACSFLINIGFLVYFKYTNFFLGLIQKVMNYCNVNVSIPTFDIVLPVGISFFIFQSLSYTVDVYRGDIEHEKNIINYALFVSFFPQLVAGPIERSKNLLKQLREYKPFNFEKAFDGFLLMLWGYVLKLVLADRIAIFVDAVYGDVDKYGGMYLVVATILFAFQIYCDFAGYSTIAVGAAKVIGVDLMENFNAPYLSFSISQFWRNWHISLTSWFKDYLYIPLGGSRKGKARKYLNKLIVFLVSGLWHGADLSYVTWGGLNGIYQIIEEMIKPVTDKIVSTFHLDRESIGHKVFQIIISFILVDFSWIFFRAKNITEACNVIKSICTVHNTWVLFDGSLYNCGLDGKNFLFMIITIVLLLSVDFLKRRDIVVRKVIMKQDSWCKCIIISAAILFILVFGEWGPKYDAANFIYFQF